MLNNLNKMINDTQILFVQYIKLIVLFDADQIAIGG